MQFGEAVANIVALRNENGSYNPTTTALHKLEIVALRNENGSYNCRYCLKSLKVIVALRNENVSYNSVGFCLFTSSIVALQNGKDTPLIDSIILTIERILHTARRAFQKKCLFSYRDLRWFITR